MLDFAYHVCIFEATLLFWNYQKGILANYIPWLSRTVRKLWCRLLVVDLGFTKLITSQVISVLRTLSVRSPTNFAQRL